MKTALAAVMLLAFAGCLSAARNEIMQGNSESPVKVIIYDDLQCSDCAKFQTLLDEKLLPKYGARVAFIHRDFPLGKHDWARTAAIATRWVHEQNPAIAAAIRRELLQQQNSITAANLAPWLQEFARRSGLDPKGITASLTDPRLTALVEQDLQSGKARGVTHTPTVFLGAQSFIEIIIYEDLARAIDEALK